MTETAKWYEKAGNCGDVVISTRVRLARNPQAVPLPGPGHRQAAGGRGAEGEGRPALRQHASLSKEFRFLPLESASEEEAVSLVERHIVMPGVHL